ERELHEFAGANLGVRAHVQQEDRRTAAAGYEQLERERRTADAVDAPQRERRRRHRRACWTRAYERVRTAGCDVGGGEHDRRRLAGAHRRHRLVLVRYLLRRLDQLDPVLTCEIGEHVSVAEDAKDKIRGRAERLARSGDDHGGTALGAAAIEGDRERRRARRRQATPRRGRGW